MWTSYRGQDSTGLHHCGALAGALNTRQLHQILGVSLQSAWFMTHRGTQLEFTTSNDDARLLWNIAVMGSPETCRSHWHPCEPTSLN